REHPAPVQRRRTGPGPSGRRPRYGHCFFSRRPDGPGTAPRSSQKQRRRKVQSDPSPPNDLDGSLLLHGLHLQLVLGTHALLAALHRRLRERLALAQFTHGASALELLLELLERLVDALAFLHGDDQHGVLSVCFGGAKISPGSIPATS